MSGIGIFPVILQSSQHNLETNHICKRVEKLEKSVSIVSFFARNNLGKKIIKVRFEKQHAHFFFKKQGVQNYFDKVAAWCIGRPISFLKTSLTKGILYIHFFFLHIH